MPLSNTPLSDLLPKQWQNPVLSALLAPADAKAKATGDLLESYHTYVDPALVPDSALDWLADVYGLPLWQQRWTNAQKRSLLTVAKSIRRLRGSLPSLTMALSALGLTYKIHRLGASYLPFTLGSAMGAGNDKVYVKLPREYPYQGRAWQDTQAAVDTLMPAGTFVLPCHEHYYLSVSVLGSPLFAGEPYFDWGLMPLVPESSRSRVATACILAASGQSYSAKDVYLLLSQATVYFGLEAGSLYNTGNATVLATQGQSVGCARDWRTGALLTQPTVAARPTMSTGGLTFTTSQWLESTFALTGADNFTTFVRARPLGNSPGTFVKVGNSSPGGGWGIGIGTNNMDTAGLNLIGLHEWVNWIPSTGTLSTSVPNTVSFRRGSGTTRLYLGETLVATETSSINTPTAHTYLNGLTGRRTNSEISALVSYSRVLSDTEHQMVSRYLQMYST